MKKTILPILVSILSVCSCCESETNIAFMKAAWQSSSMDYNYTAQLVTDGLVTEGPLSCFAVSDNGQEIEKSKAGLMFDYHPWSYYIAEGRKTLAIRLDMVNIREVVDAITLSGYAKGGSKSPWTWSINGSQDGTEWDVLGCGKTRGETIDISVPLPQDVTYASYELCLASDEAIDWHLREWGFFNDGERIKLYSSLHFCSAWVSGGTANEWVYVDFGADARFSHVTLNWINKAVSGTLEVSDDAKSWKKVADLPGGDALVDEIDAKGRGRYLRLNMDAAADGGRISLSEMKVLGKGGSTPPARSQAEPKNGRFDLTGGWELSRVGSDIWVPATVPGTVLVSYIDNGAVPDPDYADNQLAISDSYFCSDFLYRDRFVLPEGFRKERLLLNFDGINWKADVSLNGKALGKIEGAFTTACFDVTDVAVEGENELEVLIHRNDDPALPTEQSEHETGKNGGALGADNPTFHASVGWDWIPTIRGRNIGIWNDVYLTSVGAVTISDPVALSTLNLPDTTRAEVKLAATLVNRTDKVQKTVWKAALDDITVSREVELQPCESKTVSETVSIENPRLWWPVGYGKPELYDLSMEVGGDGALSDSLSFKYGIRQMSYDTNDGTLRLYINGRRFIGRGGNWGFSESNLRYTAREYDIAVAYHADMNFTMIRNWVGMIGDDELYEACDRHGVMVWQDFWLANPADGPEPNDEKLFMDNAYDITKRVRNHPSIALYCGRNEGDPPATIDRALSEMVAELHPGIIYFPSSADHIVNGRGPYTVQTTTHYYELWGEDWFHSERGMPNVVNYESLISMMPEDNCWPVNDLWGLHDFTSGGAQNGANFTQFVNRALGESSSAREFTRKSQFVNHEGYRAMFESRSRSRRGLLLWMSHPAWPSMVWQTYDYYFDPTAAYFGCKKANEPLHIKWNAVSRKVEAVNLSAGDRTGLQAVAEILDVNGKLLLEQKAAFDIREDSTVELMPCEAPETGSDVWYIRLRLLEDGKVVSENFYIEGKTEEGNIREICRLGAPTLTKEVSVADEGESWRMTVTVSNTSDVPALMIRIMAVKKGTMERILPVFYEDNWFSLMPGEAKTLSVTVRKAECKGQPDIAIMGTINND